MALVNETVALLKEKECCLRIVPSKPNPGKPLIHDAEIKIKIRKTAITRNERVDEL